jgi:hypothetical protein
MRWVLRLTEFDYEIRHRPGKANANCDTLSRFPVGAAVPLTDDETIVATTISQWNKEVNSKVVLHTSRVHLVTQYSTSTNLAVPPVVRGETDMDETEPHESLGEWSADITRELGDLAQLQNNDPVFGPIKACLKNNIVPTLHDQKEKLLKQIKHYTIGTHDVLLRVATLLGGKGRAPGVTSPLRICVPEVRIKSTLELYHDSPLAGHLGVNRTATRLLARYWWPTI